MFGMKRERVLITLVAMLFLMAGCKPHAVDLTPKAVRMIDEALGINTDTKPDSVGEKVFLAFVAWDSEARQAVEFNRAGEAFTSRRITAKAIEVKEIEKISAYSVVSCKLMDNELTRSSQIDPTSCNLFRIDGGKEALVCKKRDAAIPSTPEQVVYQESNPVMARAHETNLIRMPTELVAELISLAEKSGVKIKRIDFASAVIYERVKADSGDEKFISTLKLLVSEDDVAQSASTDLLESVTILETDPISPTFVSYTRNPCCILTVIGGAAVELCYKKCF